MPAPSLPQIDTHRLWQSLMELAAIGATELGGVRRLALTDLDRQGRDRVCGWLREAGCSIRVDAIGNIFAIRPGTRAADPVGVGSHIDTQPSGGKFDGNYGVLAGLEVVRALNDARIATEHPIAVAIWTNEEGSRFTPVMMGSGLTRAPSASSTASREPIWRASRSPTRYPISATPAPIRRRALPPTSSRTSSKVRFLRPKASRSAQSRARSVSAGSTLS